MKSLKHSVAAAVLAVVSAMGLGQTAVADETCNSPYMARLIKGQEQFVHVWTLGVKGMGDGSDKLVTVDSDPKSKTYGKVIHSLSVGGRGEAHHVGFSDDRKYIWAGRLDDSKIFIIDVGTDPANPKLVRTIDDFAAKTGYVGPHTYYALPGRMLIQALSNAKDHSGITGLAMYSNTGELIETYPMPKGQADIGGGDGYAYDIAINARKNVLLTSSFTGWTNYMMDFSKVLADPAAMKNFGNTMVIWDLKAMKPTKVLDVPGAPLEIRWALNEGQDWAITSTALTSKLWLVKQDQKGEWQAKDVGDIGDPSKVPFPVDISIAANGKGLWVNTFADGTARYYDMTNPEAPKQVYEKVIGKQLNMVSQSWDGKRVYFTSSIFSLWDKKGADDEQFLKAYDWDGKALTKRFELDFYALKLGRAHHMKFSAKGETASSGSSLLTSRR